MSRIWVGTTWPITIKIVIPQTGVSLGAARSRPRGRAGCSCERVPANKSRGDWEQGVNLGNGRAILNRCDDRRGRVGWAAMGAGDGMPAATCRLGR